MSVLTKIEVQKLVCVWVFEKESDKTTPRGDGEREIREEQRNKGSEKKGTESNSVKPSWAQILQLMMNCEKHTTGKFPRHTHTHTQKIGCRVIQKNKQTKLMRWKEWRTESSNVWSSYYSCCGDLNLLSHYGDLSSLCGQKAKSP